MNLVMKDIVGVDFEREEIIACSANYNMCEELATRLNEAVEDVELFDNICSVRYYVKQLDRAPVLLNQTDIDRIFDDHKEDRG